MSGFIRKRPLVVFWVLAFLIGFAACAMRGGSGALITDAMTRLRAEQAPANLIVGLRYAFDTPVLWSFILFPAAPTLAALVVIALGWGGKGFKELGSRLKPWRGVGWRQGLFVWIACYLAFFTFMALYMAGTTWYVGGDAVKAMLAPYGDTLPMIVGYLLVCFFVSTGPMLEEIGWRGFALPVLMTRFTPLMASVILGVMWGLWHFPRDIPMLLAPTFDLGVFALRQFEVVTGSIALCVIVTWVYNKLGGVVWAGVLIHAVYNETAVNIASAWQPRLFGPWRLLDVIEIVVAVALVLILGPQLGRTAEEAEAQKGSAYGSSTSS